MVGWFIDDQVQEDLLFALTSRRLPKQLMSFARALLGKLGKLIPVELKQLDPKRSSYCDAHC
jgi:hypothetical protein